MIIKKILVLFFLISLFSSLATSKEIKILYKIDKEIITNHDVNTEIKYLSLNRNFNELDKEVFFERALRSLIREKIKKNEIEKFYNLDYDELILSKQTDMILNKFISNYDFSSIEDLKNTLQENGINLTGLKKKLIIEQYWNQLIIDKYKNNLEVNEEKVSQILESLINNKSQLNSYNLSEIVFLEIDKKKNDLKYNEILKSIKKIGFKETAVLYSISESGPSGGKIGWVNENQISNLIYEAIKDLNIGEYSNIINTTGGSIILKIEDKKIVSSEINIEEEKNKIIIFEKNRLLNQFSILYYKQLENKMYVEKF